MNRVTITALMLAVLAGVASAQDPFEQKAARGPVKVPLTAEPPLLQPQGEPPLESEVWVGEEAPDFELDASDGSPLRLSDLRGGWSLLVFDQAREPLARVKYVDRQLDSLGVRPYGVCRDGWEALRAFAGRDGLPYLLLSDMTGEISQAYGMYDAESDAITPGVVLLDPRGVVRATLRADPQDPNSLEPADILRLVRRSLTPA